ncbi:hypothetical protein X798_02149 [Onchocerca flexuosa]|uniref:Uncharacterized protein n=2 Tax=Onchocerca flexuosa TaxID=387005 RepID=A0A183GZW9_9BILA|nr:hypothetical protein X798_02149 [Onchocerca flexuosa]VDO27040.1 unnamed protein product [Onchocerca flexuosa]
MQKSDKRCAESKFLLVIFRKRISLIVEKRKAEVGFAIISSNQNGYWICTLLDDRGQSDGDSEIRFDRRRRIGVELSVRLNGKRYILTVYSTVTFRSVFHQEPSTGCHIKLFET